MHYDSSFPPVSLQLMDLVIALFLMARAVAGRVQTKVCPLPFSLVFPPLSQEEKKHAQFLKQGKGII